MLILFYIRYEKHHIIFTKPNLQCTYKCIFLANVLSTSRRSWIKCCVYNTLMQVFYFFCKTSLTTVCTNVRCIKQQNLLRTYEEERRKYYFKKRIDFFSLYNKVLGTPKLVLNCLNILVFLLISMVLTSN